MVTLKQNNRMGHQNETNIFHLYLDIRIIYIYIKYIYMRIYIYTCIKDIYTHVHTYICVIHIYT